MSLKTDILTKFENQLNNIPEVWNISAPLRDKVSDDATYLPFYGYTSVFHLQKEDQDKCKAILDKVISISGNMLIPLPSSTFHITAHEFANEYTAGRDKMGIDKANEVVLERIANLFHSFKNKYGNKRITLRALGPSTSGSDVVSIKFIPDTDEDEAILSEIFNCSEEIWPIGKKYMPHVSLGYFKLEDFDKKDINSLYRNLSDISANIDMKVSFSVEDLVYQRHFSMEDFRDLYSVNDMDDSWREKCLALVNM